MRDSLELHLELYGLHNTYLSFHFSNVLFQRLAQIARLLIFQFLESFLFD